MPELVSLLDAIREKGFEASLITTYCAYLPFYEDVVLRRLLANGCRHNTLLMDASQLAASLVETYPKAKVLIAVEPATVRLTKAGAGRVKGTWHDASEMTGRTGYLHAKLVYFDTNGRGDLLCVGSANPSAPAWGVGGSERNEELGVGTLVNRMVRVLAETAGSEGTALTAVAQLTAVLCTLRALRQLDRQDRWRQTGISLVPEDCRYKMLDGILDTVIGGGRPLMRRSEVTDAEHSMEVGHLRGLMIWLAWECKFRADQKFSLGDEIEDRDHNVLQRAALLELVVPAVPDTDACAEAERSVESTATARQTLSAREWLQTHLVWGRRVQQNARIQRDYAPQATGSLARGTIVALPSGTGRSLHVVAGHDGGTVVVFDLTVATRERQFLRTKVVSIAPP